MTDSEYWKDLARQFREHLGILHLLWTAPPVTKEIEFQFSLVHGANKASEMALRALCTEAGMRLDRSTDKPMTLWLTKMTTLVGADIRIIHDLASVSAQSCSDLQIIALRVANSLTSTAQAPIVQAANQPKSVEAKQSRTDPKAMVAVYVAQFQQKIKILDICWAAGEYYREWKRWIGGECKGGSKPDLAFRAILTSGKRPDEYREEPRPPKWK